MAKGAVLVLVMDYMVLECSADIVLLLIADMVLLRELELATKLKDPVPAGAAVVVKLPIVK